MNLRKYHRLCIGCGAWGSNKTRWIYYCPKCVRKREREDAKKRRKP